MNEKTQAAETRFANLPNQITVARLALSFVFFILLGIVGYETSPETRQAILNWSTALFMLAMFTDFLDGYLARRCNIESTFGRDLQPAFGDQRHHVWLNSRRNLDHLIRCGHLQVKPDLAHGLHSLDIVVLNMAAIFAQVHGDQISAPQLRLNRCPYRIGLDRSTSLPHGGDMVNVHAQLDHGTSVAVSIDRTTPSQTIIVAYQTSGGNRGTG